MQFGCRSVASIAASCSARDTAALDRVTVVTDVIAVAVAAAAAIVFSADVVASLVLVLVLVVLPLLLWPFGFCSKLATLTSLMATAFPW